MIHGGKIDQTPLEGGDNHAHDILSRDRKKVEVKACLFGGADPELKFEPGEFDHWQYCCLVQVFLPDTGIVYPVWSREELEGEWENKSYAGRNRIIFSPHRYAAKKNLHVFQFERR
jgi:hypothetical protein